MKRYAVLFVLPGLWLLLLAACAAASASKAEPEPEVAGVRIGMSREAVRARLGRIGRLEKEERKQQEIWSLERDPRFSHLMIGYNKTYTEVRYVTATAREGGRRLRYSDVLDLRRARQTGGANNNKYTLQVAARAGQPAYVVTARGAHARYLTYLSVEKID